MNADERRTPKLYREAMDRKIRTETWPAKEGAKSGIRMRLWVRKRNLYVFLAPFFAG
jgi:hypothetical protein